MVLHTVMPAEVVWWPPDAAGEAAPREVVAHGPRRIWVRRDAAGRRLIERLDSTDPSDYLDPRLQPGAVWQEP